ncbi:MAG TPA: energy transducer TonB [Candidatus Acidoferrum sp.]|jgi:TonB family protein
MKFTSFRHSLRFVVLVFLSCGVFSGFACAATPIDLDDLAAQLAPEIEKAGIKSVAIVDFVAADEKPTDLGWYLANKLSDSIILKSPSTVVVDRIRLQQLLLASIDPGSADSLKRIGTTANADTVISGKIEITPEKYLLAVTMRKVSDGSTITSVAYSLPHSRILDLLSPAGDHASGTKAVRAGVMGVGVPLCFYCPIPADTARWRSNQPQNVVLQVVISRAGAAEKINVVTSPGYFLSERAIEAVSEWKFRPAPGEDGKPTTVVVPIEVTFKTLRS